jgi:uncharacterized protein YbjT (DUF2867 family)
MAIVVVTGGASGLGRDVTHALLTQGWTPRVFTRRRDTETPEGAELTRGDLRTGEGLSAALAGATTIIHCASNAREPGFATDIEGARALVQAAKTAGIAHLLYVSIVGVDRSDYPYYKAKREAERIVESSEVPWTTLRATQFHDLVYGLLRGWDDGGERLTVPAGMRFQSVARHEVAERIVELVSAAPSGYAPPMRGPETLTITEMANAYLTAQGRTASVEETPQPGVYTAFRTGVNLLANDAPATLGQETWAEFLRRQPAE